MGRRGVGAGPYRYRALVAAPGAWGCWWSLGVLAPSSCVCCSPAAFAVGVAASRAPSAAACGRASSPLPVRMPLQTQRSLRAAFQKVCMPQYVGHHLRASPPAGRSCRRPWRCRVPTGARPRESAARLRSWRRCTTHLPPLSGGLWALRIVGIAGTRAWRSGHACARRAVPPPFRSHSAVRTRETAVRAGVRMPAGDRGRRGLLPFQVPRTSTTCGAPQVSA